MFDNNSRYKNSETYTIRDRKGRMVTVVTTPEPAQQTVMGYHLLKQGQRLDHLAYQYLQNATAFWRIAEINGAMLPEILSEQPEITIPNK